MLAKEIITKIEACIQGDLSDSAKRNQLISLITQLKLTQLDKQNRSDILNLLCNEFTITNVDNTTHRILSLRHLIIWAPDILPTLFDMVSVLFPEASDRLLKATNSITFNDIKSGRTQNGWQLLANKSIPSLVNLLNLILSNTDSYKELVPRILTDPDLLKIDAIKEKIWPAVGRYYYESISRLTSVSPLINQFPEYIVKAVSDYICWTMLENNKRVTVANIRDNPDSALAKVVARNPEWQKMSAAITIKPAVILQNVQKKSESSWVRAAVAAKSKDTTQQRVHMASLLAGSNSGSLFSQTNKENTESSTKSILYPENGKRKTLNVRFILPEGYGLPPTEDELCAKLTSLISKHLKDPLRNSASFENILIFFYQQIHNKEKLQRIVEKVINNTSDEQKNNITMVLEQVQDSCKPSDKLGKSPIPNEWEQIFNSKLPEEKILKAKELISQIDSCLAEAIANTDRNILRKSL